MGDFSTPFVRERSRGKFGTNPDSVLLQIRALSSGETAESGELGGDAQFGDLPFWHSGSAVSSHGWMEYGPESRVAQAAAKSDQP